MSLDVINESVKPSWHKIFETSFLIAPATTNLKKLMVNSSMCGTIGLDQVIKIAAEHVLLDWKCLKSVDGSFMPYTKENAVRALTCNGSLLEFVLSKSFGACK